MKCPVLTLAPALLVACNERFEFDVPPETESATSTGTTGVEPDGGADAGCTTDSDCGIASLRCHSSLGQCVECLADQDCSDTDAPHCDAALLRCVRCTSDADCAAGSRCDAVERSCAPTCETAQDCVAAHACNDGVCVACDRDVECRENDAVHPVCSASGLACVNCREDAQCPQLEFCDVLSGRCVDCLSSADCSEGALCDPVLLECVSASE